MLSLTNSPVECFNLMFEDLYCLVEEEDEEEKEDG
jgi:hypothetical protein